MSNYLERCVKCGQFEKFDYRYCNPLIQKCVSPGSSLNWYKSLDHLHCTCRGCKYDWIQPCADAKKSEPL